MDNKQVYCALDQAVVDHSVETVTNPEGLSEIVVTCVTCGHALKYAGGTTEAQLNELLAVNQTANAEQIIQPRPAAPESADEATV